MGLFSCRSCELAHERELALLAQIRDLTAKLTALADVRAQLVVNQGSPEAMAARARPRDTTQTPGMLNPSKLPPIMRSLLSVGGHFRSPVVEASVPFAPVEGQQVAPEQVPTPSA